MTDNLTFQDHAELWAHRNGETVPERDTVAWCEFYVRYIEWAFSDFENVEGRTVTSREIRYKPAGTLLDFTIPKGTPVIPAVNLPGLKWWARPWEGAGEGAVRYAECPGFLIQNDEVVEVVG